MGGAILTNQRTSPFPVGGAILTNQRTSPFPVGGVILTNQRTSPFPMGGAILTNQRTSPFPVGGAILTNQRTSPFPVGGHLNQGNSVTLSWLRCHILFSLFRSSIMAIRSARSSRGHQVSISRGPCHQVIKVPLSLNHPSLSFYFIIVDIIYDEIEREDIYIAYLRPLLYPV